MSHEATPLVNEDESPPTPWSKKTWILISIGAIVIVGVVLGIVLGITVRPKSRPDPYEQPLFPDNISSYLMTTALKLIEEWGSRAPGTPGATRSVDYLKNKLQGLLCDMSEEIFSVPVFNQIAPSVFSVRSSDLNLTLEEVKDFVLAEYGGNGSWSLVDVPMTRVFSSGCETSDWATFPGGHVAMMDLGLLGNRNCSALERATNAQTAGAAAVVFRIDHIIDAYLLRPYPIPLMDFPWYEGMSFGTTIPVLITSYMSGTVLLDSTVPFTVDINTNTTSTLVPTQNIFCDTRVGDASKMIIFGAHYDSVPQGPGDNDNGSGSVALLEILSAWSESGIAPVNKVRFAWWGAEELGLLGSFNFVHKANQTGLLSSIKAYINMDMLGSRNGYTQIHHPAASNPSIFPNGTVLGCEFLANTLIQSQRIRSYYSNISAFESNSDYYPFVHFGVPASGIGTGAGNYVSYQEAYSFDLIQNAPMDSCYHQACDTMMNVDQDLLEKNTKTLALALYTLANDHDLLEHLGLQK